VSHGNAGGFKIVAMLEEVVVVGPESVEVVDESSAVVSDEATVVEVAPAPGGGVGSEEELQALSTTASSKPPRRKTFTWPAYRWTWSNFRTDVTEVTGPHNHWVGGSLLQWRER
jgi:hypothetical protein